MIGIPATGAKSRVETHIKLTIQLVDGRVRCSGGHGGPARVPTGLLTTVAMDDAARSQGQKVRGYEYLRLPEYALISNRPRLLGSRNGKLRASTPLSSARPLLTRRCARTLGLGAGTTAPPAEANVLSLQAEVVCASAPGFPISVCNNCVTREVHFCIPRQGNRVGCFLTFLTFPGPSCVRIHRIPRPQQKRARYRRERGGADDTSPPEQDNSPPTQQVPALSDAALARAAADTQRILLFNCSTLVEFSSGDAILPTRITCYCRHHNEKIGFWYGAAPCSTPNTSASTWPSQTRP